MDIFIARNGQTSGPFDLATINAQLVSGQLLPQDLCWSEAQPVWQALTLLEGVQLPAPRPVPPPPPPGAPNAAVPPPAPQSPSPQSPSPQSPSPQSPSPQSPSPQNPYGPQSPGGYPNPGYPQSGYPAQGQPGTVPALPGGPEEERVIFDTSASPLAVSGAELVLGLLCTCGLWTVYAVAVNLTTRYKLTTQRLTTRSGIISQRAEEIEVYRVRDVTMEQGTMGRMLGFGDVIVHASDASSPRLVLKNVSSPERIKEQIRTAARQGRRTEGVRSMEFMP